MEMSFLDSIGYLMAGSGLQEVLETVYAEQVVCHMLTDKAVDRAIRGHMLVDAALHALLVEKIFNVPLPLDGVEHNSHHASNEQTSQTMHEAGKLFDGLLSGVITVDDINNDQTLKLIKSQLSQKTNELQNDCTSQLWIQYMRAIDILRKFIKAEHTGNWELHLQAVYDMLPFFTASGHNLYAKSAYLYLQLMLDLPNNHPELYDMFMNGFHVIQRSDRYWAGVSSDMLIEQTLMRSLKTSGGLTQGRGMDEIQRLIWIMSKPACSEVNDVIPGT